MQHSLNVVVACTVRNLMYGFGDDRNPANDTVNVMEEILIEYIVDVVSLMKYLSVCAACLMQRRFFSVRRR